MKHGRKKSDYMLSLYLTGMSPKSVEALATVKSVCERYLHGNYQLEVIDLYQHPELAGAEHIVATPTLVKRIPPPSRHLIGNLSEEQRVVSGLGLKGLRD